MELNFDEKKHIYTLGEEKLDSVTTILKVLNKPALIQWAANMAVDHIRDWFDDPRTAGQPLDEVLDSARTAHAKKKTDAGVAGTEVHAEIEKYIKHCIDEHGGEPCPESEYPTELEQTAKFIEWANIAVDRFLASELRLYSKRHKYAGTADFIYETDKQLFVGDVKTSSAIYPEHYIQTSAYAEALKELRLFKRFRGLTIVNLPKKGGINVESSEDISKHFEAFKACLVIHEYQKSV